MSIGYRRPVSGYRLREQALPARLTRAARAIGRWLASNHLGLLLIALCLVASERMYRDDLDRETRAKEAAIAQRDEAANWNRTKRVRLVLEGERAAVANLAQQFANLPQ